MARTVVCAKGVLPVNLRLDEKLVAGMARREEGGGLAGTIYAKLQENCKTALVSALVTVAESRTSFDLTDFRPNNEAIIFRGQRSAFMCDANGKV